MKSVVSGIVGLILGVGLTFLPPIKTLLQPVVDTKIETITETKVIVIKHTDIQPKLVYVEVKPTVIDTLVTTNGDSVAVEIPMEHKVYEGSTDNDSVKYTAHVSGYKALLDSIEFQIKKPVITITNTVTHTKKERITYGIQAGLGYGLINRKPDVFIGAGIQFNF